MFIFLGAMGFLVLLFLFGMVAFFIAKLIFKLLFVLPVEIVKSINECYPIITYTKPDNRG